MSTDDQTFKPLDPGRVDPLDAREMAYWCREFGCTLPQLEAAIARVGEHVTALREELERVVGKRRSS
ncbi:DUF3606 domain-containing protein [Ramlibacter sp. 2FC]|uniref:DUF3606 domain-containing protein n=1 Tax=Ramlibacter sp. 2FC TaxID=2502188 RepID=UPI0010F75C5E|nr:DUF3606 domain-containing protein [Ramlibacter sp. 2FC]